MSLPELRVLTPDEYPEWDRLVEAASCATYFHRSDWLIETSRVLGVTPRIYGYFVADALVAGCSLHLDRIWPGLPIASSVSECSPHGGLVITSSDEGKSVIRSERLTHALCGALDDTLAQGAFDYIQIQSPPGLADTRGFSWKGWISQVLYTYRLLTQSPKYSRTTMKHIALANRQGVAVERSTEIDIFSSLLKAMYIGKGVTPAIDVTLLEPIFERLIQSGDGELWVSRAADETVLAADLIIVDSKRAYRWTAASRPERNLNGAVFYLISTVIDSLRSRSISEYYMMTANIPPLAEFTSKFNPELVPYYHSAWFSKRYRWLKALRDLVRTSPDG